MTPRETTPHGAKGVDNSIGLKILIPLAALSLLAACDDLRFPRDVEDTLETVLSKQKMTVAVSENPPWVVLADGQPPQGVEADLTRAFAEALGVAIEWKHLGAFAALEGLEKGDIDLAIGGFTRKDVTPVKGAAPSYAYFEESFVIGSRGPDALPHDIEGQRVFVPPHLPLAALVEKEGGIPVDQWAEDLNLAAVPHWQLDEKDLTATETTLQRAQHVVAVQQGENAWLMEIEGFLRDEAGTIGARLRASAP
ncbi:transporter substrate-binding domain-containing protein [Sulfitobacter sp. 1A13421]|uniref:transporter substrate-binding domain-containing protein n=1 Tax=Sulfitobacter sp. 1A13421 TaxID=3368595 RepID=UPI0037454410